MADAMSVYSEGRGAERNLKKYHEGWVQHQAASSKSWSKYWMVLRANMLFIFQTDRTHRENMVGTLTLNESAELDRATNDKKKGPFKFELITSSPRGDRRINKFKFDKENDRDLWKAFIIGITVGIVPSDVHLLPGQLKDVHEVIAEVRNRPPPVPSSADRTMGIPRPKVMPRQQSDGDFSSYQPRQRSEENFGGTMNFDCEIEETHSSGSSGSGSFGSHLTRSAQRSQSVPSESYPPPPPSSTGGTINNLRELMRRQEDLTSRILDSSKPGRMPTYTEEPEPAPSALSMRRATLEPTTGMELFPQLPAETTSQDSGFEQDRHEIHDFSSSTPNNNNNNNTMADSDDGEVIMIMADVPIKAAGDVTAKAAGDVTAKAAGDHGDVTAKAAGVVTPKNAKAAGDVTTKAGDVTIKGAGDVTAKAGAAVTAKAGDVPAKPVDTMRSSEVTDKGGENAKPQDTHVFYLDQDRNRESPSWFFEECERDEAEQLLTVGRKFGNVLMRPSSTFSHTGKYVISMRREVAGGTNLNHYEVVRTGDGFKINVDNKHSSMRCLSDVMDFFVSVAGPGTHPLRTNDRSKIYQSTIRLHSTSAASPNVTSPKRETPAFGFDGPAASPGWSQPQGGAARDNGDWNSGGGGTGRHTNADNWSFGGPSPGAGGGRGRQDGFGYGSAGAPAPPAAPPPPPPPVPGGTGLQVQGNVSGQIAQAVEEMNQSFTPRAQTTNTGVDWQRNSYLYENVPTASNGSQEPVARNSQPTYGQRTSDPYGDYGRDNHGGLNAAVPPRNTPMETLQRQAGHVDDITGGMQRMYSGHDAMPGGPPPPPPMQGYGGPSSPTYSNYPSQAGSQVGGYGRQETYQPPPPQPRGPVSPAPRGGGGGARFNEGPSFENELKNRLVRQREEIYASGAQVLRSNYT